MNFALIGVSGFIAPKHLKAIKDLGHNLVAALDPSDCAGILDEYFPEAEFFTETERFDRYLDKHRNNPETKIHYVSICSPNYLHDAHIRLALRNGADAICEKPMVINPWNLDALEKIEQETGKKVFSILQLRYHPEVIKVKTRLEIENPQKHQVELKVVSPRGKWYANSWKGNIEKSGGLITNIGIHYFDLLTYLFGNCNKCATLQNDDKTISGTLELEKAYVNWFLSIDQKNLPDNMSLNGKRTYKSLTINGDLINLDANINDLHRNSYSNIISKKGFTIEDSRTSIELIHQIRNNEIIKE